MWRSFLTLLIAIIGCNRIPDDTAKVVPQSSPVPSSTEKTVRVVLHTNPFNFDGVDRISIVGKPLKDIQSPIPFSRDDVKELDVAYVPAKHSLSTGQPPDYIIRFLRPDGFFVDFLISGDKVDSLIESTRPYLPD